MPSIQMKASEVIKKLENLQTLHGDLEVLMIERGDWYTDFDIRYVRDSGIWDEHIGITCNSRIDW